MGSLTGWGLTASNPPFLYTSSPSTTMTMRPFFSTSEGTNSTSVPSSFSAIFSTNQMAFGLKDQLWQYSTSIFFGSASPQQGVVFPMSSEE